MVPLIIGWWRKSVILAKLVPLALMWVYLGMVACWLDTYCAIADSYMWHYASLYLVNCHRRKKHIPKHAPLLIVHLLISGNIEIA